MTAKAVKARQRAAGGASNTGGTVIVPRAEAAGKGGKGGTAADSGEGGDDGRGGRSATRVFPTWASTTTRRTAVRAAPAPS